MQLKFAFVILFCCLFSLVVLAQSNTEDVVYLKNGGVTRGTILEIIPDSSLKIQTVDRNIFVYKFNEIEKILKEPLPFVKEEVTKKRVVPKDTVKANNEFKKDGFHNITKFGPYGFTNLSLNMINGYQFNPFILLGLGVGLDTYKGLNQSTEILPFSTGDPKYTDYFLPIYADFRFHISKSRASFLVFFDMGYSCYLGRTANNNIDGNQNYYTYYSNYSPAKGGTFFCPGVGFKVFVNKKAGIVVDLGLKFQNYKLSGTSINYGGTVQTIRLPGLVAGPVLNFGFAF